jgi:hypothetical protein
VTELIASITIDAIIIAISLLLVKKIKPNKSNLLNLAFGTFWLGIAGIYFFAGLSDLSGIFNSVYFSRLFFMIAIALAAIPVVSLALFLSATSLKGKIVLVLPFMFALMGLAYIYFVVSTPLEGPLVEWTVKYNVQSPEAITLIQYSAYSAFTMVVLLGLIAFKSRKSSTFIQFNSVAISMGLFFIGGYLDILGSPAIETVLFRAIIVIGAAIAYIGFSPSIKLMKLMHRLT